MIENVQILGIRDKSYSNIIRKVYDIAIDGRKTDAELLGMASIVKCQLDIFGEKVSAIAFFFWQPDQVVGKQGAMAAVDWAPGGLWEDASVPGEYGSHEYKVMFNNT